MVLFVLALLVVPAVAFAVSGLAVLVTIRAT